MNNKIFLIILAIPSFLPFFWRLSRNGLGEPVGLLSDTATGLTVFLLAISSPRLVRLSLLLLWALFQAGSQELYAAMQRLPSWQDLQYLTDPNFIGNSASGMHLAYPFFTAMLVGSAIVAGLVRALRPRRSVLLAGALIVALLLLAQNYLSRQLYDRSIAARFNPLHWFVSEATATSIFSNEEELTIADLPPSLRRIDLSGTSLLADGHGKARNVLIIALEGIPGLYLPEIRKALDIPAGPYQMEGLAAATADATLVPNFITHSHQTIRGLYSMLCGDFSKFSYDMPKAFELQFNPQRAEECLPAELAANGWDTHYLQGAGLAFMSKDQIMPNVGFQQVHGNEWFTESDPYPFMWGKTDPVFFRGARQYIAGLQTKDKPWFLTLLTVGTHQPYAVPDNIAAKYPNRMIATVAILDQTVADFLAEIRADGLLDNTLVLITSDESHGDDIGEWASSWGLMAILAPEGRDLPRIKEGIYGLVDVEASVLDYLGLPAPKSIIGRSMFRDYRQSREMVSYTNNKLRWLTSDNRRFECYQNGSCGVGTATSLIGPLPQDFRRDDRNNAPRLYALASGLDHKIAIREKSQVLHFARGEIRRLPEKIINDWTDNLAGAQYLDFPANSKVYVSIRIKALKASAEGILLKLLMRQFEHEVSGGISPPPFPVLHTGEEGRIEFEFDNPIAKQKFSFHLVGEGKDAEIRLEEFDVTINRGKG